MHLFSDDTRRDPYPLYAKLRAASPVLHVPPPFDLYLVLDYDGVKRVLADPAGFSSAVPAPREWFLFFDPPRHTKRRALISRAFTPRMVAGLEGRIRRLSGELLDRAAPRGTLDVAGEYAVPLAMTVIAEMIGIPPADWQRFRGWSDAILRISYTMPGASREEEAVAAMEGFVAVADEMSEYFAGLIEQRRAAPRDDLLTALAGAEVDGERLTHAEILGFMQLLVVAGQETTANLVADAVLTLLEHPAQLALLRGRPELLPSAVEEVLRYRSPLQWTMRTPREAVTLHGTTIPPGKLVLPMIGSANRDAAQFERPDAFDITRGENPHLAFGYGIHFCLGAALARLEARVALADLLSRLGGMELAYPGPWEPRKALNVLGPTRLPVRFRPRP